MDYKKISFENYNLHLIKTDKFKTISIKINFKTKLDKINVIERILLSKLFILINKDYIDERELTIKNEELYNPKISFGTSKSGFYNIITVESTFLNEKYTEENMNFESINFIKNLILNIDIKDKKISSKALDRAKRSLYDELISIKENPSSYASIMMREAMDKDSLYAINPFLLIDKIETITEEDIYNTYMDMINCDSVDMFLAGDLTDDISDMFKNLPFLNKIKHNESHTVVCSNIKDKENVIIKKDDNTQSKLCISFKLKDVTEFEKNYVVGIYNYILGGSSSSKLFKNVREKNSLCYFIGSRYNANYDILEISSGINGKNFELAVSLIKEELLNMENGNFDIETIDSGKKTYINSLENLTDSQNSIINLYLFKEYFSTDLIEERIDNINKVTKQMIIDLSKKIHIDTIYLLKGETDDNK